MRKQSVGIALSLGFVLMAFQNCSSTFMPEQTMQNDNFQQNPAFDPEPQQYEGVNIGGAEAQSSGLSKATDTQICPSSSQKFDWPFGGVAHRDWIVQNYVDVNSTAGAIADFSGATGAAALTYDGHLGVDINVPNFRAMDGDFPVLAAAAGTVIEVISDNPDRSTTNALCGAGTPNGWNGVKIKHASGIVSLYAHMKRNSPVVAVGQVVAAGQKIGVVGSSGCSVAPHLHFQVIDCNKNVLDPFRQGMFNAPPLYTKNAPTTLMDTATSNPVFTSVEELKDPGGDPASLPLNQLSSVGFTMASLKVNDQVSLAYIRPDGTADTFAPKMVAAKAFPISHWWLNWTPKIAGTWQVRYLINNKEVFRRPLKVE